MFARFASFARDASGAVAPLFAVGLIGFVGVGALAWDISRGYALRGELEAAVDAAALAGATQLDGKPDAISRATTAAQGALVQNSNRLADAFQANTVGAGDQILFLTNLTDPRTGTPDTTGTALTATDDKANFIEITLAPRPMSLVLGVLVGATGFNARAHAVAGYGSAICKVPPLMICNPDETTTYDANEYTGKSLVLTPAPSNGSFAQGLFGFLQVNGSNAATYKQDAMGRYPPLSECYGDEVVPSPGNVASADDYFNTRFDIYRAGTGGLKTNANYPPALNTLIGVQSANTSQHCTPSVIVPSDDCSTTAAMTAMGLPLDCDALDTPTEIGDGHWNVVRYFATNHPGINPADKPNNAEGTGATVGWSYYGPDTEGVTSPTRYQVYEWEKAILRGDIIEPLAFKSGALSGGSGTQDHARPKCSSHTNIQGAPDRRTISAVVVNCSEAAANNPVVVRGYVDIFLIGPAVDHQIFGEFIQATTDTSEVGKETRFYSVRLYE